MNAVPGRIYMTFMDPAEWMPRTRSARISVEIYIKEWQMKESNCRATGYASGRYSGRLDIYERMNGKEISTVGYKTDSSQRYISHATIRWIEHGHATCPFSHAKLRAPRTPHLLGNSHGSQVDFNDLAPIRYSLQRRTT